MPQDEQKQPLGDYDDIARLSSLNSYGILDTPAEEGFDDVVLLAAQLCETPVALVSFVASDRQWFKARIGFDQCETPLSQSVCRHALRQPGLLIIPDLTADPRTRDNTLVTGPPFIRFYAGARLETKEGHVLGTLCVIDSKPRAAGLTDKQQHGLEALARQVVVQLDLRRAMRARDTQVIESIQERNGFWQLSQDIMLRCSFNGIIKTVNPAWKDVLGWSSSELVGSTLLDLIHPDDIASTIAAANELAEGHGHTRFDNRCRHKDSSYRWISWSTRAGDGLINAVGRDFTEEHDQAEALRLAEEALRQSQKMEAVGQLTGGIAHDFNNLLAVISGSLELLALRVSQGRFAELDRFISAAQTATRRASSLTHRLLAFSRRQTLDPKPTAVNKLVLGMKDIIERTAGPAIRVKIELDANVWTTFVDPHQLENALLNLCINAKDAMPDGGQLEITTSNQKVDREKATKRDMTPGDYVALNVGDTGCGMAPEVVARAVEPFYTTKPTGQGTGLGLSMVYGFARQSEGQVLIHSEVQRGTTVTVYLPRSDSHEIAEEASYTIVDPAATVNGQTVLIVDDEANIRMLIVNVLRELGYCAIEANDGPAALQVLQSDTRIDLLITDVGMPGGMNGRQLADAGRALRPGLKTLFITGYAETAVMGNGGLEQGMAVITKPFTMNVLSNCVKDMITIT